jgi:hypothetical protein
MLNQGIRLMAFLLTLARMAIADFVDMRGTRCRLSVPNEAHAPFESSCRRPWSLMYFTDHSGALPCCIAPVSVHGYSNYTLGDATRQELREIWNSPAYRCFHANLLSDAPVRGQVCGMRWSH